MNVAEILIEALPYIKKFAGVTVVIKYGGHAMVDNKLKDDFAKDIVLLKYVGLNPVIVHGGGPQISMVLDQMGIATRFVKGLRVTDKATMDVVEMVLGGRVNKSIVNLINQHGGKAVGLTGKDGGLLLAKQMKIFHQKDENTPPEIIDPGMVGEITKVNPDIIKTITAKGFIPVIAPVAVGEKGETFNINADYVAGKIASSLNARKLILLTDVDGIMTNSNELITNISSDNISDMIKNKIIYGGMIPKVECAVNALMNNCKQVHIINGRKSHAVLLELFTDKGIGTEISLN